MAVKPLYDKAWCWALVFPLFFYSAPECEGPSDNLCSDVDFCACLLFQADKQMPLTPLVDGW